MNSASDINLAEVLKKIFNEKTEILIKTDAEIAINFKKEINLAEKLTQAVITWVFNDNAVLII